MITKEKYDKLKREFSRNASWAVWNESGLSTKTNMRDVSMFDSDSILEQLNPAVVFVGFNPSGVHDGYMDESRPWCFFHSSYPRGHDYKLRYALINTDYWGGYITDFIKTVLGVDSSKVDTYLKEHPEIIDANVKTFFHELSVLQKDPLIVALGNRVYNYLVRFVGRKHRIIKIKHYSCRMGQEEYRREVLKILNRYSLSPDGEFVLNQNVTARVDSSKKCANVCVPAYEGPCVERTLNNYKLSIKDMEEIRRIDEEEFGNRRKNVDRGLYLQRRNAYEWATQQIINGDIVSISNACGQRQSIVTPGLATIFPQVEGHKGIQRTGYYCVYEIEIREKIITVRFVAAITDEIPKSTLEKIKDVILPVIEKEYRHNGRFYTKALDSMTIDKSTTKEIIESFLDGILESIKQFESRLFSIERMTWHAGDTQLFCDGKKGKFINGVFVEAEK